jgi:hypothetical protein
MTFAGKVVLMLVRLVTATVLTVLAALAAHAEPITHRSAVMAGEAIPTGGSFSVTFPIAFNDLEIRAEDPPAPTLVTHLLMGLNSEGLRVSAMEISGSKYATPIDSLMEVAKARPGTIVSDISRGRSGGLEMLSFSLTEPKGGSYFKLIRSENTQYTLVIQFPEAIRSEATVLKDGYFGSFKIMRP